jgi:hypothetical protein
MLLNTIFGVILASVMIVGLSSLDDFSSSQEVLLTDTPPVEESKIVGGNIESSEDFRASPEGDIAISEQIGESSLEVFTSMDPIGVGAPFTIALAAGLVMFIAVRNRLD